MLHIICWMIALATYEPGAAEATDWMKPPSWSGNYWGPAATRAARPGISRRSSPTRRWPAGSDGDARCCARGISSSGSAMRGSCAAWFPSAGSSPVRPAVPSRTPASSRSRTDRRSFMTARSAGVQRQPFEVWMLDSLGALGVKRLKPEHRERIAGVIDYCRAAFERQVPFDYGFRMEDDSLYCLELTEKAFRSQGLALSEPVRIGDWEYLASFPLTALLIPPVSGLVLDRPITLEQPVYVPGNERNGVWASPLLETVFGPAPKVFQEAAALEAGRLNMRGDLDLLVFTFGEVRRSYDQLPARLLCDLVLQMRVRRPLLRSFSKVQPACLDTEVDCLDGR